MHYNNIIIIIAIIVIQTNLNISQISCKQNRNKQEYGK